MGLEPNICFRACTKGRNTGLSKHCGFSAQIQALFKTRVLKTSKKMQTSVLLEPVPGHTKIMALNCCAFFSVTKL